MIFKSLVPTSHETRPQHQKTISCMMFREIVAVQPTLNIREIYIIFYDNIDFLQVKTSSIYRHYYSLKG